MLTTNPHPPAVPIHLLLPPTMFATLIVAVGDALAGALVAGAFTVANTLILVVLPRVMDRRTKKSSGSRPPARRSRKR